MIYKHTETGKMYYGGAMTVKLDDSILWSGIPTADQLLSWGYEEYVSPIYEDDEEETDEISAEEALNIITGNN